jgi:hypothetical protein
MVSCLPARRTPTAGRKIEAPLNWRAFCFGYWKAGFSEWANLGPLLLRTQLIVLHGVRSTSFVGAFGPRFSANTDSKPPTQRAAVAQQIRLSAPRNISSLKLRDLPALNIVAPSSSLSPKIVKPILRSNPAGGRGLTTAHARGGPAHLHVDKYDGFRMLVHRDGDRG